LALEFDPFSFDEATGWVQLTSQEAVQLHEELEVRIVALRRLAVRVAHVVTVEIDTYTMTRVSSSAFLSSMLRSKWLHLQAKSLSTSLAQSNFLTIKEEAGSACSCSQRS
jgi:hypothetical protein